MSEWAWGYSLPATVAVTGGTAAVAVSALDDARSRHNYRWVVSSQPRTDRAVFLSYASQDAAAARRVCDALRAAGVEVWFDQSELRGGDAWDQKIRRLIKECALFVPIVSANTQSRREGYFRLEWKLADDRTQLMARGTPFLVPVCVDDTKDWDAIVPDSFMTVQWVRLPGGETSPAFCERMRSLLAADLEMEAARPRPRERGEGSASPARQPNRKRWLVPAIMAFVVLAGLVLWQPWKNAPLPRAGRKSESTKSSVAPASEARQLIARAWVQLNKTEMARAELDAAGGFCRRAAELDSADADVWATWAYVDTWYVYHNFDSSPKRREAARDHTAQAMRLAPRSYEARLAQACFWVRAQRHNEVPMYAANADRLLRELLGENPDEPRALFALGILQRNTDKPADARATFERLAQKPEYAATAWNEIGWASWITRDFPSVEASADRSIALQPFWGNLGLKTFVARAWLGDLALARETLDRMPPTALQEDFGATLAMSVHQWRRDPQNLLRVLDSLPQEWLRSNSFDGPKAFWTGEARQMAKQTEAARRDFRRALDLIEKRLSDDPNNRNLLVLKTLTLHALNEREEAEKTNRLIGEIDRTPVIELRIVTEPADTVIDYLASLFDRPSDNITAAALRLNPCYDPLRSHPRFAALLARAENDPRLAPKVPK